MPTGYTSDIEKGISFRQYAMGCARAFGALITMRDDPHDAPIPEKFEPSPYYLESVAKAKARIAELEAMTAEEVIAARDKEYADLVEYNEKGIRDRKELRAKYEDILAHARGWVSPSPDHDEFKQFMISQIEDSIQWDCDTSYYEENQPEKKSPAAWIADAFQRERDHLAYSEKSLAEEVARVEKRNLWVRQLREALK